LFGIHTEQHTNANSYSSTNRSYWAKPTGALFSDNCVIFGRANGSLKVTNF